MVSDCLVALKLNVYPMHWSGACILEGFTCPKLLRCSLASKNLDRVAVQSPTTCGLQPTYCEPPGRNTLYREPHISKPTTSVVSSKRFSGQAGWIREPFIQTSRARRRRRGRLERLPDDNNAVMRNLGGGAPEMPVH